MVKINVLESSLYNEDLLRAIKVLFDFSDLLRNKSFLITGCNGLICSAVVDIINKLNEIYSLNIHVYLATRNSEKTKIRFNISKYPNLHIVNYDANKPFDFNNIADFYIHGASNASPELFISNPVETIFGNILGVRNILEKTRENNARTLYISSSEVYGKIKSMDPIKETDVGYINLFDSHSSYGLAKRISETVCEAYRQEYLCDYVIVRPGHIYGPTAFYSDKRVSSQFMYAAIEGRDIVLKSDGKQLRSYCYCLDAATAIIWVLIKGDSGGIYNISNPDSVISIMEMARYFATYSGVKLKFAHPSDVEKLAFNPMENSSLDSKKLLKLGWVPSFSKEEGFEHTVRILKQCLST